MTFSKLRTKYATRLKDFVSTDIPLEKDIQSKFLITLVALMSFLLVLACAGSLILSDMSARWSSGLENKLTIEITSETKEGYILSQEAIRKETKKLTKMLRGQSIVKSAAPLSENEIRALISPWINADLLLNDISLPGLIALELKSADALKIKALADKVIKTSKYAHLESHREWLDDVLSLMQNLKTLSLLIAALVLGTTIIAMTTAMHARLALYRKDVELLHLMGASDDYIARQFLPHTLVISLKGSTIGGAIALILTLTLTLGTSAPMIPALKLSFGWVALLALSPIAITTIALITSRITLLRTLLKMP